MLEFLLALLTTATVALLLVPLLRRDVATTDRLQSDLAIYRDQLGEVERERAAGTLSEADALSARTEIERRILVAADKDALGARPSGRGLLRAEGRAPGKFLPPALCLLVPLFALGVYLQIGQPGVPSAPYIARTGSGLPTETAAGGADDLARLITAARVRLAATPDDAEALSQLGELLTEEADGVVTEPAVEAFGRAYARNPGDARALFYLGLHEAQAGDSRAALRRWLDLEARSPANAPWLPTLRAEIERVAHAANIDPQTIKPDRKPPPSAADSGKPPAAAGGMPQPSSEQMAAMANMTPEQRQQAIRGMVEGLAAKLRDNPDDRDGWLKLARARAVLDQPGLAAEAFARADALAPLEPTLLADWAADLVRQIAPGAAPSPAAVAVLNRLEKAQPDNGLALFYLGAASFAQGDKPEAARRWKRLLALLPADAPIRAMLEQKIREAE